MFHSEDEYRKHKTNLWTKPKNFGFFFILRPHFQNSLFLIFFFMFSVLNFIMKQKKLLKTKHHCTFVYVMNFTNYCPFLGILLLYDLVSNIFTIFFRGSEVCLEKCDSCGNLGYEKTKDFILREICKRTHCPPIVTLALLLFIHFYQNIKYK